jgi:hypothetical protein
VEVFSATAPKPDTAASGTATKTPSLRVILKNGPSRKS